MWQLLRLFILATCWTRQACSQPITMGAKVTAMWSSLGQWATSITDNYTQYSFRYKTFDLVRLATGLEHYNEAVAKCANTGTRLPRFEDLGGDLFQRLIFNNNNFITVSLTKQVLVSDHNEPTGLRKSHQWTEERGRFFLESPETRVKRLIELGQNSMLAVLISSDNMQMGERSPTLILCVQERQQPRPPPPPPPPTPTQLRPPTVGVDAACACSGRIADPQTANAGLDFAWPLASVAFLGVLCLSLATALLVVCRMQRKSSALNGAANGSSAAGVCLAGMGGGNGNGNSMPRTTSSLMDFNQHGPHHHHHQEKAHSLAATTMPRRPRVIHNGQVHTNGYLTLGSIQARKQREMQREIGLSEPPSPNHSIARSDYQQGAMSVR